MIKIFAGTHKRIASNIYDEIENKYGISLDKRRLLFWSYAPDILPQYKFIRHYKNESIDFITEEILKLIYVCRYTNINKGIDPVINKILSKKIGLISHYISDYFCLPHANYWTFKDSMAKHVKYESDLDEYAKLHNFRSDVIESENLDIESIVDIVEMKKVVKQYIETVIEEYSKEESFANDLNYANSMNIKIANFVIETVSEYSEEIYAQFAFEL